MRCDAMQANATPRLSGKANLIIRRAARTLVACSLAAAAGDCVKPFRPSELEFARSEAAARARAKSRPSANDRLFARVRLVSCRSLARESALNSSRTRHCQNKQWRVARAARGARETSAPPNEIQRRLGATSDSLVACADEAAAGQSAAPSRRESMTLRVGVIAARVVCAAGHYDYCAATEANIPTTSALECRSKAASWEQVER